MIEAFTRLFRRSRTEDRLYECRRCGKPVSSSDEVCPACSSSEIGQYDLG